MARSLTKLNFNRTSHAVSGFLTVIVMPLTYSIAYGLIAGIGAYVVMEGVFWILSFVGLEIPIDEEQAHKPIIGQSFRKLTEPKPKTEAIAPSDNDDVEESLAKDETVEETHASDNANEVDEEAGK
jgi:hypothetical protein